MGSIENSSTDDAGITFTFKEYQYKDSPKNVCTQRTSFDYLSNKAKSFDISLNLVLSFRK